MLKKENRLLDFSAKKAQIINSPLFNLKVFFKKGDSVKIGVVVSKKVDKRAVVRNEAKRVLKKAIKTFTEKISDGTNIAFYVKKPISFEEIEYVTLEIERVLIKANILK